MKSIRSVFKEGNGPSSSHTVGPYNAAKYFKNRFSDADSYEVILYGSLALTGKGHGTDKAIHSVINNVNILHDNKKNDLPHPNTMLFKAFKNKKCIAEMQILSIGGGSILLDGEETEKEDFYIEKNFSEIIDTCKRRNISIPKYVYEVEGEDIKDLLKKRWQTMKTCINNGLSEEGELPGGLQVVRKAKKLYTTISHNESPDIMTDRLVSSFAYACAEENASEKLIVTAPTCGSCGVIPAVLYYMEKYRGFSEDEIVDALAVAAIIGNVIRTNASISGAECGCQAEIGSACSMAAGALAQLYSLKLEQIEYAAEVAMEHHLGLTCDPVNGLVQIPCIERNAVAATRAMNAVNLARFLYETRKVSFDTVVETMYRTGLDMNERYKETSNGGLAVIYS